MKLYAKPGFEAFEQGRVGHWCPVLTGRTDTTLLDCNLLTSNHGTLTGYTSFNDGWSGSQYGTAASFNGSSNRVNLPSQVLQSIPMTFSAWVMRTSNWAFSGNCLCWAKPNAAFDGNGFYIEPSSSAFSNHTLIVVNGAATNYLRLHQAGNTSFPLNIWTHFAFTISSSTVGQFFLNGVQATTTVTGSLAITATSTAKYLMNNSPGYNSYTPGMIAEVTMHARSLELHEIQYLYQAGPGGAWQPYPRRPRSYFAQVLTTYRNRSSRYLCFPG